MEKLGLAWLTLPTFRMRRKVDQGIRDYYERLMKEGVDSHEKLLAEERKALRHKTDFTKAIELSVPVGWRSCKCYRLRESWNVSRGVRSLVSTVLDHKMYELGATFCFALKSGDIRDEGFDERESLSEEEYKFRMDVADRLEELVNDRCRKIHREEFYRLYKEARERIWSYEMMDLKNAEVLRRGAFDEIRKNYDRIKECWHGKTAGIAERTVMLTLYEGGLLEEAPDAAEAIIKYQWFVANIWMWADEIKDLDANIMERTPNRIVIEGIKRGLNSINAGDVYQFIRENPDVIDGPLREYLDGVKNVKEKLEDMPWLNFRDYDLGARVILKKLEERREVLIEKLFSTG
ncbi:MAG: hypothetical protein OEZ25_01430 [Candidatus Bathyarchaeota archaeon]|nr:hypothetical protein [Candidatus Bathyarchaeota archaeon]